MARASDRGSGSVLAVGLVAGILCLAVLCAPLLAAMPAAQHVAGAADAAALAAADVASGALPGVPCETAGRVASANGVEVGRCDLDGTVATVSVSTRVAGFEIAVTATAGSPPETTE